MHRTTTTFQNITHHYYRKGKHPSTLFVSGIHGDEYAVIESVIKAITKHENALPDFLYIPYASPSALAQKTRCNNEQKDLNRHFFDSTSCEEARALQHLLAPFRFNTCVTFHEDLRHRAFYLYDTLEEAKNLTWHALKQTLLQSGTELLNGLDDPEDPTLGNVSHDGYITIPKKYHEDHCGIFEMWVISRHIAQRAIIPEIPGHLDEKEKNLLVDMFISHMLLP